MLVSADTIVTSDGSTGARTIIVSSAVSARLLAVVLHNPVILAPALVARRVGVYAVGVWGRTVIIGGIVVGGSIVAVGVSAAGVGENWVAAVLPEVAVVVVPGELDVSVVSPGWSPGVLDEHVVGVVADSSDGVVGPSSASGVLEDATSVGLEPVGYFESNRESSRCESLDVGLFVGSNSLVSDDFSCDHGIGLGATSAGAVSLGVSVVGSRGKSSSGILGVIVAVVGPSTVASVSGSLVDTVEVLLFSKVPQNSSNLSVSGLQASDSSESPAASASSLVLYSGDESLVGPLFGGWGSDSRRFKSRFGVGQMSGDVESKPGLFLHGSHGGEHVETEGGGFSFDGVYFSNELGALSEDTEPKAILGIVEVEVLLCLEVLVKLEGLSGITEDGFEVGFFSQRHCHEAENDENLHASSVVQFGRLRNDAELRFPGFFILIQRCDRCSALTKSEQRSVLFFRIFDGVN